MKFSYAENIDLPVFPILARGDARSKVKTQLIPVLQQYLLQPVKPKDLQPVQPPAAGAREGAGIDIFLSYSHKDKDRDYAHRLAEDLETKGYSVWIDDRIDYGDIWPDAIQEAVDACNIFVVIMTPNSYASPWVKNELARAQRKQKRLLPLLLVGDEPWLIVEAYQYIDVRNGKLPPQKFYERLAQIKQPPAAPTPVVISSKVTQRHSPIEFDWVTIPAGEFLMGSDKQKDSQAPDRELPQHPVYLPEYRISRVPVTNAQYKVFVQATGQQPPEHWQNGEIPQGKENHPVVYVAWQAAQAFCRWAGVRLPTEAEWEKAARGTDGRIWPWGNEKPTKERSNFADNIKDTTPVEKYPKGASPYGLLDMAGNVWEWTSSLYKGYPYKADDGREDLESGNSRTLRGGSWGSAHDYMIRCAERLSRDPNYRNYHVGFRVVSSGL